jgi:hypothetical protein
MRLALMFLAPLALISQTVGPDVAGQARPAISSSAPNAQPTTTQPTTPPEDLASIEGQVGDAATGAPVRKANLSLRRIDANLSQAGILGTYGTVSDTGGKFAIKDIEPGKYQLSVSRTGYVTMQYGARAPNRPGVTLSLSPRQQLKEVNFRLIQHGVISGRILDEDGEPIAGVQVQTQSFRYVLGKKQLTPAGGGNSTNDLGEFRIFGLAPGKDYLSAIYRSFDPPNNRFTTSQPDEDYVPTYYPGTIDSSRAVPLEVTAGGQLTNISLSISKARTVRISGRITNLVSPGGTTPNVMLGPRSANFFSMGIVNRPNQVDRAGRFEIRGVIPGSYWLTASVNQSNRMYSVRQPVDVGSSNIENLVLAIGEGAQITGSVRIDGETSLSLTSIRVYLQPREPGIMMGPTSNSTLKDDGSFHLTDVSPDRYNLSFPGLPDGLYVKSIRVGDNDVLATGLDLTSSRSMSVEVVLSPRAGEVIGIVQSPNTQQAAPGATVVLVPQEDERRTQQTYYKIATTDQMGAFTLKSVVPGEYRAYAWEEIEPGAYIDPDFMKPFESKGQAVSVPEGGHNALQLTLIPADAVPALQ